MSQPARRSLNRKWIHFILGALVLILLTLLITQCTVQNFHIQGHSMEPTLQDQEYMLVNKAAYFFDPPRRGDVIVFRNPRHPQEDYVKRIIAIPGDVISVVGETVVVNGVTLNEFYVSKHLAGNPYPPLFHIAVGQKQYFVLGDNRRNSSDSRQWGFVPRNNIIGKAVLVYWPLTIDNVGMLPDVSHVFAHISDN